MKNFFYTYVYMKSLVLVTSDFLSTLKHVAEEPPLYRENNETRRDSDAKTSTYHPRGGKEDPEKRLRAREP